VIEKNGRVKRERKEGGIIEGGGVGLYRADIIMRLLSMEYLA
jgi:hypothetical protein